MAQFLKLQQVLDFLEKANLKISRPTLYRWISKGEFPEPKRVGGQPRWLQKDLDNWFTELTGQDAS